MKTIAFISLRTAPLNAVGPFDELVFVKQRCCSTGRNDCRQNRQIDLNGRKSSFPDSLFLGLKLSLRGKCLRVSRRFEPFRVNLASIDHDLHDKSDGVKEILDRQESSGPSNFGILPSSRERHSFNETRANSSTRTKADGISSDAEMFHRRRWTTKQLVDASDVLLLMNKLTFSENLAKGRPECSKLENSYRSSDSSSSIRDARQYTARIAAYGKDRRLDLAFECFEEMSSLGLQPNIFHYNALLSACIISGKNDKALAVWKSLLATGLAPDTRSYNTLISGYARMSRFDEAFDAFKEMEAAGVPASTVTYTSLINAAIRASPPRIDLAVIIFRSMLVAQVVPNLVTFNTLMHGFAKAGLLEEAFDALKLMDSAGVEPDAVSYNTLMHMCFESGRVRDAMDIYDRMRLAGIKPTAVTYGTVISGLSNNGQLDRAFEFLGKIKEAVSDNSADVPADADREWQQLRDRDTLVSACTCLLDACARLDDVPRATAVVRELSTFGGNSAATMSTYLRVLCANPATVEKAMLSLADVLKNRAVNPTESMFAVVMDALVAKGSTKRAVKLLLTMLKAGVPMTDSYRVATLVKGMSSHEVMLVFNNIGADKGIPISPDLVLFSTMIDVLVKDRDVLNAEHLLRNMRQRRIRPDVFVYSSLISGYGKAKMYKEACEAFADMRLLGIAPNSVCYTAMIDTCVRGGDLARATELLREMRLCGMEPTVVTYNTLIRGCGRLGRIEDAWELYADMQAAHVTPCRLTFTFLLDACIKARDPARAMDLLRDIEELVFPVQLDVRAYSSLVKLLDRTGHPIDDCFRVLEHMQKMKVDVDESIYTTTIRAAMRSGRLQAALDGVTMMHEAGKLPDLITISSLIRTCTRMMRFDEAFRLYDTMRMSSMRPDTQTYAALIELCIRSNSLVRAMLGLREMEEMRLEVPARTYHQLIDGFGEARLLEEAFLVFDRMQAAAIKPDETTYRKLIDACVRSNEMVRALLGLKEMNDKGMTPTIITLNNLIHTLGKQDRLDEAFSVLDYMNHAQVAPSEDTYTSLIDASARSGDMIKAVLGLRELEGVQNMESKRRAYNGVIRGFGKLLQFDDVISFYERMQQESIAPDDETYRHVISACLHCDSLVQTLGGSPTLRALMDNLAHAHSVEHLLPWRRSFASAVSSDLIWTGPSADSHLLIGPTLSENRGSVLAVL